MVTTVKVHINPAMTKLGDMFKVTNAIVKKATNRLDTVFRKQQKLLFATGGSSGGASWAPLSTGKASRSNYARDKGRKIGIKPILTYTGDLSKSYGRKRHPDHIAEGRRTASGQFEFIVGSSHPLAKIHRDGRTSPTFMPKRNPVQHTSLQTKARVDAVITPLLVEKFNKEIKKAQAWKAPRR